MNTLKIGLLLLILSSAVILQAEEDKIVSFSETIFYDGSNAKVKKEIERIISRKINFKAQTSFSLDLAENKKETVIDEIEAVLTDVENFKNIPYYSKRHDSSYPLFKDISILEDINDKEGKRIIRARQTILPFKPAYIRYTIEKNKNSILFKAENTENIRWWILPIITKQKLLIIFSAEINNNKLECYGLGTADTGSFFLMRQRLKDAFNGRTEALIRWIHKMLISE